MFKFSWAPKQTSAQESNSCTRLSVGPEPHTQQETSFVSITVRHESIHPHQGDQDVGVRTVLSTHSQFSHSNQQLCCEHSKVI